ncbi:MAG: DNA repair protein RadA, partial [Anaerolineales bacterium]|nr:DNA repair protein RadA [Anaerolineales bacterium]
MIKSYAQYVCQDCGYTNPRYLGRCPSCGNWDTLVEEQVEKSTPSSTASSSRFNATSVPRPIQDIHSDEENRIQLKHEEFSRVLGGGLVPGSINLIGGDPGIGKSTL